MVHMIPPQNMAKTGTAAEVPESAASRSAPHMTHANFSSHHHGISCKMVSFLWLHFGMKQSSSEIHRGHRWRDWWWINVIHDTQLASQSTATVPVLHGNSCSKSVSM
jgi:hypothetical protein